jgi:agmatinase
MWMKVFTVVAGLAAGAVAHEDHGHEQEPVAGPHKGLWYNMLPGDGGTQVCWLPLFFILFFFWGD